MPARRSSRTLAHSATLASAAALLAAAPAPAAQPAPGFPALAKYGCAESMPRFRNGAYEYESEGRGYVTLQPGGRYVDPFQKPGTFRVAGDTVRFAGAALDGAVATPLKEGRLWVVIPTKSGNRRWSCSPMAR